MLWPSASRIEEAFTANDGAAGWRIGIWTEVIEDVADGDAALEAVCLANMHQTMSSLQHGTADHRTIHEALYQSWSSMTLPPVGPNHCPWLRSCKIVQPTPAVCP